MAPPVPGRASSPTTRRIYAVQPDALAVVRAYFEDFWQKSLMAFRLAAEATTTPSIPPAPTETEKHP